MKYKEIVEQSRASIEKKDLEILLPLLADVHPESILEIGTWRGYSAEVWTNMFPFARFVTMDIERPEESVVVNSAKYTYFWNKDSHDLDVLEEVKTLLPNGIDFLFIDGDHSYDGVKSDFEMYSPLVNEGGIIVFHDCCYHMSETEEVDIYWREIKENRSYVEIKGTENSTGMGVIYV